MKKSGSLLDEGKERRASSVTRVTNDIKSCQRCGAGFFGDAPAEYCSACTLESALAEIEVTDDVLPSSAGALLTDFGDYELLEEIGRGGQGIVYRARQKNLNRSVALKMIAPGPWLTPSHLERFRFEAEAAASLDYPGIVPIYDVGERDGFCYFTMKYIHGGQLDEVAAAKSLSIRRVAELIAKVARMVHYAHEHGVLHRDIKPGNILVDEQGEPHLTDFGLARLLETPSNMTRTTEVLGTPSYMAPEQAAGQSVQIGRATDIYGLGAVLYQLLSGHAPFAGGTAFEIIRLVLESEPKNPRVWNPALDREVAIICLKCLEKDPSRRYPSAVALAEDLERWLRHQPIRARRSGVFRRGRKWVRRNPVLAAAALTVAILAAGMMVVLWRDSLRRSVPDDNPIPAKSIAVLPFENLSDGEENAHFAGGMQDDVLTHLAKIGDLKVISRTSVMQYTGRPQNLREIGRALGVRTVLEGSVRRVANRARINVQLIDTTNDQHIWAENFDRDVNDVLALQSNLAMRIASVLHAKLSFAETTRMERRPTQSGEAYLIYLQARDALVRAQSNDDLRKIAALYEKAIQLDPSFALAFARLSYVESTLFHNADTIAGRLDRARTAANEALRLQPELPEGHLALGYIYYWGERDLERALAELAIAKTALPNDVDVIFAIGMIERRRGKWEDAIADLEKAALINPKDAFTWWGLSGTYAVLRHFPEAAKAADRSCAADPDLFLFKYMRTWIEIDWKGDTTAVEQLLNRTPPEFDPDGSVTLARFQVCLLQHKSADALKIVRSSRWNNFLGWRFPGQFPKAFLLGVAYSFLGDETSSRSAFEEAERVVQTSLAGDAMDPARHALLGEIEARLGRKELAIQEGKRAMELLPEAKDAFDGPVMTLALARIYLLLGEIDSALALLEHSLSTPGGITVPALRRDPFWDPLRDHPRFVQLTAD